MFRFRGDESMLNKEKYAKEIISVAEKGRRIALVDGKVVACEDIDCNNCEWGGYR